MGQSDEEFEGLHEGVGSRDMMGSPRGAWGLRERRELLEGDQGLQSCRGPKSAEPALRARRRPPPRVTPAPQLRRRRQHNLLLLCLRSRSRSAETADGEGPRMPSCERPCGCSRGPNVEDGKWYGVRSYLHLFYEDCAGTPLSDDPEGPPVLCPHRRWPSLCWKISLSSGTLLLLLGLAALTTGYAVPPKLEGIGEGEFLVLDQRAADYNKALGTCRLAGTVLCGAAGILLAICMFWATTGWLSQDPKAEPLDTETDGHMEVFGDELEQQLSPIFHDASGRSWFSPPASHFGQSSVQTIQPKRDF
ncbi:neurensin-2 [Monodon monoceros]|uniref:neurensin-2 n=1 Tax=Monodon monoceros TaxID=40151 RepID=UPI0010FA000C|nr:neurensin-2 [Monodon monoceros]